MPAMSDPTWTVEDLPLLGETFAVELANTRYVTNLEDLDVLADADAAGLWFAHAPAAADLTVPARLPRGSLAAIRQVRDATRLLLGSGVGSGDPAAEVLHRASRRAAAHLALGVDDAGAPTWHLHHEGRACDVLVAAVAGRCILFLGGADAARVRRCEHPGCPMVFVQRHRGRRFCHETCAHSARQARYYRSMLRPRRADPAQDAT